MFRTLFFFLLSILVLSCQSTKMIQKENTVRLADYFEKAASKKGSIDFIIPDPSTKNSYNLRLITPIKEDDLPKPLILALHWAGGNEDYKVFSDCLIEPAFQELDAYIIVPDAEQQIWYTEHNQQKILELMEAAITLWNVDKNKILVTGYSNGGNGSWYYAEHHANLFSAAIPMASAYKVSGAIKLPIYLIHGEKDDLFPVSTTLDFAKETEAAGTDITIKTNERLSHFEACAYAEDLKAGVDWWVGRW